MHELALATMHLPMPGKKQVGLLVLSSLFLNILNMDEEPLSLSAESYDIEIFITPILDGMISVTSG
jgi:hypothetical protein